MAQAHLKLAVVGPTHPYKGGVATHTTMLAHHLADSGHDVTLVSWRHLYPARLYPGEQSVPGGTPDVTPFPRTVRVLSWARPDTWLRTGRRLRSYDAIVVVHVVPAVVPAHLALLKAAGAGGGAGAPRAVVIAHNVLPHEGHPGDSALTRALFAASDGVLVHSSEQAQAARDLAAQRVAVAELPPHLPGGSATDRPPWSGPVRLLTLGIVRDYKGVDVLVKALAQVPELTLTIAGELWGESGRTVRALAADPRVKDRVTVRGGYVPADELAALLARHDVLALTYRSATASQNALLGHAHGLPVLASDVGTFGSDVLDGVDGLLVPPNDEAALVAALERLREPGLLHQLQEGVHTPDLSSPWAHYLGVLESLATAEVPAEPRDPEGEPEPAAEASLPARAVEAVREVPATAARLARRVSAVRGPRLVLRRGDLPEWVRPTDVLTDADDADEARRWARDFGLPRTRASVPAWAALGALAAIVRLGDDGRHSAVIVDESGPRSPLSRWARAVGFAPVELDLTKTRTSVAAIDVDPGTLDVVARLHPGGCTADDVGETMSQASWALRPGGLLTLTLPLGPPAVRGAVGPAEVRGIRATAGDLGFVLVGDLDGRLTAQMRQASVESPADADTAYALVRLTFRRR